MLEVAEASAERRQTQSLPVGNKSLPLSTTAAISRGEMSHLLKLQIVTTTD